MTAAALKKMVREYTHEAGVRALEREIGSICRKVARQIAEGPVVGPVTNGAPGLKARVVATPKVVGAAPLTAPAIAQRVVGRAPLKARVTQTNIGDYLGQQKYHWGVREETDQIGVATGVARTELGGDVLGVEVTLMPGKGSLTLTGQLGDVMRESAQAALTYARSRAAELGIPLEVFEKNDIHVHVPAGGVPKEGPSAGITIATAMISALTRRPISRKVAMTGEITLRGRVLPVGGLKEKILAAHRAGIKTFVLPKRNEGDLEEVPATVMRELRFVFAGDMADVLRVAIDDVGTAADRESR